MANTSQQPHAALLRRKVPAVLMRAGTSKGLFFKASDLPASRDRWNDILLASMGSPDPFGRQLNGCGGGSSTTSKIAVVGPSSVTGVDVDYTFVAVPIGGGKLDFTGNCGNMASGVGPFAIEEGLVTPQTRNGQTTVTFRNTNTGVILKSTFTVTDGIPLEDGECTIDGVAQSGDPIKLAFLNPAGSMTGALLPSGQARDILKLRENEMGLSSIEVSLVDAANPFVLVRAEDLGLKGNETTSQLVAITDILMSIRCAGAVAMGLAKSPQAASKVPGTPKICLCSAPAQYLTPSGRHLSASDMDMTVRPFSMGTPHPSLQMTGAVCLAAACAIPGSIPHEIVTEARKQSGSSDSLRFGHASGVIETEADLSVSKDGKVDMRSASVYRTARRLFEGKVTYLSDPESEEEVTDSRTTPSPLYAGRVHPPQQVHLEYSRKSIVV